MSRPRSVCGVCITVYCPKLLVFNASNAKVHYYSDAVDGRPRPSAWAGAGTCEAATFAAVRAAYFVGVLVGLEPIAGRRGAAPDVCSGTGKGAHEVSE